MRSFLTLFVPVVVIIVATLAHPVVAAQDAMEQKFHALLETLNHADDAALVEAFINENFSPGMIEMLPKQFLPNIHAEQAPMVLHSIRTRNDTKIVALVRGGGGQWLLLSMATKDGKINGIGLTENADPPKMLDAPTAADSDAWGEAILAYANDAARHDVFSGAVLAALNGRETARGVWGEASKRHGVANVIDTKFNLGSMNKMFTAVSIAQLAEQGKLSYDDYVGAHLPDYPNQAVRETVTIHHLLSHTSGMGSHFTEGFIESAKDQYRHFTTYVPLFADVPLAFEPGAQFSYSNAGFFVLGMIVEAASGESYYDYVRTHINTPAGMINSDCYDMDLPVPNLATGYTKQRFDEPEIEDHAPWMDEIGPWRENTVMHSIKGGPAGGGFSTVEDLGAFARALLDGTLVSAATLATLTTAKSGVLLGDNGTTRSYGYGFQVGTLADGSTYFGHSGGFPGINSVLQIFPERDGFIAAMSNYDRGASPIAAHAARVMPESD